MSRKYKFHNSEGLYFVSFATVYWIDVFTRDIYFHILTDALNYYIQEGRMEIYCWCIMPSHLHLIFRDQGNHPELLLGRFKSYTSRRLQKEISLNPSESKKDWMTRMFKKAASINSNVKNGMLWQHNNMPIELWTQDVIKRKVHYIHNNPVVAGFVIEPQHWKYSSAFDYAGGKGLINVRLLW